MIDILTLFGFTAKATEYEFKAEHFGKDYYLYYIFVKRPGSRYWEKCISEHGQLALSKREIQYYFLQWTDNPESFEEQQAELKKKKDLEMKESKNKTYKIQPDIYSKSIVKELNMDEALK